MSPAEVAAAAREVVRQVDETGSRTVDYIDRKCFSAVAAAFATFATQIEKGYTVPVLIAADVVATPTAGQDEEPSRPHLCLVCDEEYDPDADEGRFCGSCQDAERTCPDNHCMVCGALT